MKHPGISTTCDADFFANPRGTAVLRRRPKSPLKIAQPFMAGYRPIKTQKPPKGRKRMGAIDIKIAIGLTRLPAVPAGLLAMIHRPPSHEWLGNSRQEQETAFVRTICEYVH